MLLSLRIGWQVVDGSTSDMDSVYIPAGTYQVERTANPYFPDSGPWIVLRGTKTGLSETVWRKFLDPVWKDFHIELHDDAPSPAPKTFGTLAQETFSEM